MESRGMKDKKVSYLLDLHIIEPLTDRTKSTSSIPTCNIENLSTELILDIIAWIKTPSETYDPLVFPQATHPFLRTGQIPVYKTLRQVSKRWNLLSSPLLFHTMTVCEYRESWICVNNIAISKMAGHVRTIKYTTTPDFPSLERIRKRCTIIPINYMSEPESQEFWYMGPEWEMTALRTWRPMPLLMVQEMPNLERMELPDTIVWLWSLDPCLLAFSHSKSDLRDFELLKEKRRKVLALGKTSPA